MGRFSLKRFQSERMDKRFMGMCRYTRRQKLPEDETYINWNSTWNKTMGSLLMSKSMVNISFLKSWTSEACGLYVFFDFVRASSCSPLIVVCNHMCNIYTQENCSHCCENSYRCWNCSLNEVPSIGAIAVHVQVLVPFVALDMLLGRKIRHMHQWEFPRHGD